MVPLTWYLIVAAGLFCIGLIRRVELAATPSAS